MPFLGKLVLVLASLAVNEILEGGDEEREDLLLAGSEGEL
jgi:hypothetical protein